MSSDEPKDKDKTPTGLVITEIAGPDRRVTAQLPKPDRFELLFADMKNHVDERFSQSDQARTDEHRKTNANIQAVSNQVDGVKKRVSAIESRVGDLEQDVQTWKTESDQRLKTHSERAAQPSEHDLNAQAEIAKEITDRQARERELAGDVAQIKIDVAPIKADLAAVKTQIAVIPAMQGDVLTIKKETQSQTLLFKRHLNRLLGNRVVQTLAMIAGTSIATSLVTGHCAISVPPSLQQAPTAHTAAPPAPAPAPAPANSNPSTFTTPR